MVKNHQSGHNSPELSVYLELLTALVECDLRDLWSSDKQRSLDLRQLASRLRSEGVSFLTKALPSLGKALDRALANDTAFRAPTGFKTQKSSQLPVLFGELFCSVFDAGGELLSAPQVRSVAGIRQLTYMFYKLQLPYSNEQCENTIRGFVEVDQGLPRRGSLDYRTDRILALARSYICSVLCDFDPYDITPRHGPGSVATGERSPRKTKFRRIFRHLEQHYPFTGYFRWSDSHTCDTLEEIQELEVIDRACAKVTLVPKDSRGPRIISMEPLEIQWIQQGIQHKLYRHVESHRLTRGSVNFRDQSVNRDWALAGSRDPASVTLDMKEASDRVSLALFDELFSGTRFHAAALSARSLDTLLPDGRRIALNKFAPMGSALCFPVEALTFWALCAAVLQTTSSDTRSIRPWPELAVFGDDLVVPFKHYDQIVYTLEKYGLLVNKDKCCTSQVARFRESCGLDAMMGSEVTPIRIKRPYSSTTKGWITSYTDQGNLAYARGLRGLGDKLAEVVNRHIRLPYTTQKCGVYSHIRPYASKSLNPGCRIRYNRKLHRMEIRGVTVSTKQHTPLYGGYAELLRNWRDIDSRKRPMLVPSRYDFFLLFADLVELPCAEDEILYSIRHTDSIRMAWGAYVE